ncbi:MAG: hypothetical protein ACFFE4_18385 [Candidatus Thorarchaeota archaeon]
MASTFSSIFWICSIFLSLLTFILQPYPPEKDGVKDSVKDGVKNAIDEFQGLLYFNLVGLAASILAVSLSNKMLKIIDKMILKF